MTDRSVPRSRAVFLGIHDYETLPKLEGVAKNIPALLDQLTDPEMEALGRGDCNVLSASSTRNDFFEAVCAAADEASDLLLIYFAGHGHYSRDGQDLLLATKKSSYQHAYHSIEYKELKAYVETSQARHKVVIIDCCHSGLAVRMGGGAPAEGDETFAIDGACVLTSAAETEESICLPNGSVFTLALASVLQEGITGPLDNKGRRGEEQSHLLTGDVLKVLKKQLKGRVEAGKAVPEPRIACRGEGDQIPLARNRAYTGEKSAAASAAGVSEPPPPGPDPLPSVIAQERFVRGLGGFERNLTPECLAYVSPGQDHETERSQLFRRLRESDDRGVLLIGAAGTGKTRTVLEVGRLALDEGWRVLHLRPSGKEDVTTEIIHQVLAGDTPALVVMDYLNHYFRKNDDNPRLDLTTLRHQLLPEARHKEIKVAFLATARPGWLRKTNEIHLYELFDEVDLRQDEEFQRLVAEQALTRMAPTAIDRFGMDRMWEICGHRPIIALLVAREVERRVDAGSLRDLSGLRASGELSTWLRSRLEEDDLAVVQSEKTRHGGTAFHRVSASELLVAAAAAAAACPQEYAEVVATAKAALPQASEDTPEAEEVVETLLDLGWLQREGPGDMLATAHDIVCDQLIESVILPPGSRRPDRRRALSLLSGSLINPRTLGRYATNLARLMNDLAVQPRDSVSELLDRWFADNSSAIGDIMRRDADAGSYALGALVYGPPWSQAAVRNWQEIAGPWLDEYGDQAVARHLLHSSLSRLPAESAAQLVPAALLWLEVYGWRQDASYVLGPLLSRTELPAELSPSLEKAIGWLNLHSKSPGAHFVLSALLARSDLTVHQARKAVPAALRWCEASMAARQTGVVLHSLLGRDDLTDAEVRRAIAGAYTWVGHHITLESSSKVLAALLNYANLPGEELRYAATLALEWLEHHGDTRRATRVLHPLLGMQGAGKLQIRKVVTHAVGWLRTYAPEEDADFLIGRLLERDDLAPKERELVVGSAGQWLEAHPSEEDADFLIGQLLARDDLTPEERELVMGFGDRWLDAHATQEAASFILTKMLTCRDLTDEQARLAIGQAMSWLELHAHEKTAGFVLQHLLKRKEIPAYEIRRATTFATEWLSQHKETKDASYVLPALLARPDLTDERADQAVTSAMSWLRVHGLIEVADRVLRPLLLRADLPPGQVRSAVCRTARWLEQYREERSAGYLLGALLARDDLTAEEAAAGVQEGLTWLERNCPGPGTHRLLPGLLGRAELSTEQRARATAFAEVWERRNTSTWMEAQQLRRLLRGRTARTDEEKLRELVSGVAWLEANATQVEALPVLTAVLEHPILQQLEPAGELTGRAVTSALAWLEEHGADVTATHLIQTLLKAPEMMYGHLDNVVAYSLQWLVRYGEQARARHVLELLLSHTGLDEAQLDAGALLAIDWLRYWGTVPEARLLMERLLECTNLVEERVRDTVAFTRTWLTRHRSMKAAGFVLEPLLARNDLTNHEWEWVFPHAMGWLRDHGTSRAARHIVTGLAEHDRVGAADLDELLDTGIAWLESHSHSPQLHRTLRSLFGRADLSEAQTRRLADCGLWWISQQKTAKTWRMLGVLAECSDLPAEQAATVESLVATRVSADPTAFDVSFVLESRLTRTDVTLAQRTKAISWSLAWLERHMPEWRSRFLLRSLLALEDLSASETCRVVDWSLEWLEHHTDGTAETFTVQGAEAVLGPLLSLDLDEAQLRRLQVYLPQWEALGGIPSGEVPPVVSPMPAIPTSRTSGEAESPSGVVSGTGDGN
ncbi:caspase family protein [Streptomyces sp. NPDC056192]|uniref:caspase, EACC1-associated type n=1 Tax=Streptomyces sp. NPDC056192 TaxID=3345743 RepID=UPI0035DC6BC3